MGQTPSFYLVSFARAGASGRVRQPSLNRLLQQVRERSGCLYFERRTEAHALREAMARGRLAIGFLAERRRTSSVLTK